MIQLSALAVLVLAIVSGRGRLLAETIDLHENYFLAHAFTSDQVRFQQETLKHHNQLRARNCVPPLELDNELSKTAQAYAEKLAAENKFEHSGNGYGENLYMMGSSAPLANLHGEEKVLLSIE